MCYRIHSHYKEIIKLEKDLRVYKLIRHRELTYGDGARIGVRVRLEGPYQSTFEFKIGESHCEPDFGRYSPYNCGRKNVKGTYRQEVDEGFHCFSNVMSARKYAMQHFYDSKWTQVLVYDATVPAGCNIRYNPKTSIVLADCLRLDGIACVGRRDAMLGWTRDLVNNLLRPKDPWLSHCREEPSEG